MILEELHAYYGTFAEMTRKLELSPTTYLGWRKKGYIPWETQLVIEEKTKKLFKASKKDSNYTK